VIENDSIANFEVLKVIHQFSLCCLLLFGQLGCCLRWTMRT